MLGDTKMTIDKPVKMYGSSWVITLTKDDRKVLGIEKEGDIITVLKKEAILHDISETDDTDE